MSKKDTSKYLVPVEITKYKPHSWLNLKTYEYKLYADNSETKFTSIKFIDINGFMIGEHMPTKLQTVYDKAAMQIKSNTVKAVSEIRQVVDGVADLAVDAVAEMKGDVSKTAGIAFGLFSKIKTLAKDKLKKNDSVDNSQLGN